MSSSVIVAFLNLPARLAKKLVQLSELYDRGTAHAEPVEVRLTQEELASTIGATRESVNKYLKYFKSKGWVTVHKGRIAILDRKALQDQVY